MWGLLPSTELRWDAGDGQSSTLRAQHPPNPCVPPPGCSRRRCCAHCAPQNAALHTHPFSPNRRKSPEHHPMLMFSSKQCCTCGFQSQLSPISAARAALLAPGWYFRRHKQRLWGSVFANAGNQSQWDTSSTLVSGLKPMGTIPGDLWSHCEAQLPLPKAPRHEPSTVWAPAWTAGWDGMGCVHRAPAGGDAAQSSPSSCIPLPPCANLPAPSCPCAGPAVIPQSPLCPITPSLHSKPCTLGCPAPSPALGEVRGRPKGKQMARCPLLESGSFRAAPSGLQPAVPYSYSCGVGSALHPGKQPPPALLPAALQSRTPSPRGDS